MPLATTAADSEFVSDARGNGVYWHVLAKDPRTTYARVALVPSQHATGGITASSQRASGLNTSRRANNWHARGADGSG